jgi:hypothetical protein
VEHRELSRDGFGVEKKVLAPMSAPSSRATKVDSRIHDTLRPLLPDGRVACGQSGAQAGMGLHRRTASRAA